MNTRFAHRLTAVAAAAAFALAAAVAEPANAALVLMLDDGQGNVVTVTDGGANDSNPNAGEVTFIGSIGVWQSTVNTVFSKPGLEGAQLDLNFGNRSTAAGTLTIMATDTDYLLGSDPGSFSLISTIGGTTTATATADAGLADRDAAGR
ncbi:MAG: hypothetical protein Tsb0027_23310 [Wenzhouxiangellaceae bacterium]